jgi:7-cyano-7-deazaguanine synthase in queuosine biosynthesis
MPASGSFFVRSQHEGNSGPDDFATLEWPPSAGTTPTVTSDLGWNMSPLSGAEPEVADLLHIAAAAYIADRRTPRGTRFTREMKLRVAVLAPNSWTSELIDRTADLLSWLTGDVWELSVTSSSVPIANVPLDIRDTSPVSLLSGGLDSFLGAITLIDTGTTPRFVGHKDTATSVRAAQTDVWRWLRSSFAPAPSYLRFELAQTNRRREPSSRSRSLMFLALGVAVAASTGSRQLFVPENGYTGINLPLRPNRGGALSTRSTHPETFRRVAEILQKLAIDVEISNPFEWMTKGESMVMVRDMVPPEGWVDTAAATISCSKLGGNWFGGSPNLNCGLCVPCMVRRATFLKAEVVDRTPYLFQEIKGSNLKDLLKARRGDISAVRYAIERGVDMDAIDSGTWPFDYDLDRVENLVERGLNELALLELP